MISMNFIKINKSFKKSQGVDTLKHNIVGCSGYVYLIFKNKVLVLLFFTSSQTFMIGSVPLQREGVAERQACVPGMRSDCDFVIKILVENCGKHKMYFLKPPSLCPAAYCFGNV